MKQRNITIDILKVIGIICIILAHVCESKIIFQLRSFDVPLMVICSAYLYKEQDKLDKTYLKKLAKRIVRLVAPVWIFFTIYFLLKFVYSRIVHCDFYNIEQIIETYLLIEGVGFVWIFRVYILAAISLPIFYKLKNKINNKKIFYILIISLYVFYEILYLFIGDSNLILKYIVYYIIPYGLLCSLIAMKLKENKNIITYCIFFFLIFIANLIFLYIGKSEALMTNAWKYPPRIYYLSYAFAIVLLLWFVIENKNIFNIKEKLNCKLITFISSHTMWIYLWHILFLDIIPQSINWILRFFIIVCCSILITFIQSSIIKKINIKNKLLLSVLDS